MDLSLPPQTPQERYADVVSTASMDGDAAGQEIAKLNATASSANTAVVEVAQDVDNLDHRVTVDIGSVQVEAQDSALLALQEARAAALRDVVGFTVSGSSITDDFVTASTGDPVCTAKGSWVGKVVVTQYHGGFGSTPVPAVRCNEYPVPKTDGTRTYALEGVSTYTNPTPHTVRVDYVVSTEVQKKVETTQGSATLDRAVWSVRSSHSWTAPVSDEIMGMFRVTWSNAVFLAYYGVRVLINGVVQKQVLVNHLGPLLGNGQRALAVSFSGLAVTTGDVVTFEAYSDSSPDNLATYERGIVSSTASISWVQ
ncbi:hypothetical protein [Corynebacterium vitaeruminis]|uniref:hypothetical protein n=1 Tax=Corynebacterium vitaeruminis TaxID=38305 RepID=UPI0023F3BDC1|nr:hypothetical protein [Corynebacterium vitaeruminis]